MKKTLFILLLLLCISTIPSYASDEITALIPAYDIWVNGKANGKLLAITEQFKKIEKIN